MSKPKNNVEATGTVESTKEKSTKNSTESLLTNEKSTYKLAGILRVLGDVVGEREGTAKQTTYNKVAKAVKGLLSADEKDEKVSKCKELAVKGWVNIKECKIDSKKELMKENKELFELLISFGYKKGGVALPDSIEF